ncbi:MAG: SUMF1/EgtB/PvdO family nonheme iron enzyme [Rhodospirillaceae bacterium]|nr:SUMF1/EgtB/PvdO family nonheme iron enzyme [Rhodospirillaceae bacterium]MBT5039104.1 SUMF1/EgtB/PvdO family nonheme iron enzyme [Rhodospirillaceae bacterium]
MKISSTNCGAALRHLVIAATMMWSLAGCASAAQEFTTPQVVSISAGEFIAGSDQAEREAAYALDEAAYGHDRTRQFGWYDRERRRASHRLPAFQITRTAITNAQYAIFVAETGHPAPDVDETTWEDYGLIHPYQRTRRHAWQNGKPPKGRADHPVVLVSHHDARAYAAWLSGRSGKPWRLPSALEWEKAARGSAGRRFPWGDRFDPARLNSHDLGPFDTLPVGQYPAGASPYGLMDAAGQIFEWTDSPGNPGRFLVKGGSWDDKGCGVCRPAARHARPQTIKHILVGFRLVTEAE